MFTFKKCSKRLKRTVCVALCLIVLSSLLVIPAGAVSKPVSVMIEVSKNGAYLSSPVANFQYSVEHGYQEFMVASDSTSSSVDFKFDPWRLWFYDLNQTVSGSLAFYYTFYFKSDFPGSFVSPALSSFNPSLRLYSGDGYELVKPLPSIEYSRFSVSPVDGGSVSDGFLCKGRVNVDSIVTLDSVYFFQSSSGFSITKPSNSSGSVSYVMPSIVMLSGDSSTIDGLENVADSIISQSQIMSQFYGDIMALLNDLYSRLGDLQSVQETANAYFSQLIPLVNSINTNTANIHSLLQTQFQLLRTLIATESGNIQDAIDQQTQDLIAYFDTVLSGSTGNMPEKSDDLESSVGNVSDAESDYQSTATERFDQLAGAFTGFSGGTLGGVTLAATLFTRVWDVLGEYKIVYTWPLLLGLCLVILGRMSRLSGGQSSSVKNRGDSDA